MMDESEQEIQIVILVVHHTKKGTRHDTMHNDNMRGSSVFGGASDTVLMFKRSETDESKRLLKPTKLRHGADESRKVRLLELQPVTLWFNDLGEVDEREHLLDPNSSGRTKAEDKIDWATVFGSDAVLQRKDIVDRAAIYGVSEATIDRALKSATEDDKLIKKNQGKYQLPDPTLSSSEAA
jgi:hypothetical protein